MGDNIVKHGSADDVISRAPSPSIWADCPVGKILADPGLGNYLFEDFHGGILASATPVGGQRNGLTAYVESADVADVLTQADNDGIVLLQQDGTDADVVALSGGDNRAGQFYSPLEGETKRFWFEARIAVNLLTDDHIGVFIGIAQPGEAKDGGGGMTAGGAAMSDIDFIGFNTESDDGDDLQFGYNEAGAGTVVRSTALKTLVASEYVRLGMKLVVSGNSIEYRIFIDGVDQGNLYAIDLNDGTNIHWPGGTDMDVLLSVVGESAVADGDGMLVDWVRCAQLFD
jgi:hypothetical protein